MKNCYVSVFIVSTIKIFICGNCCCKVSESFCCCETREKREKFAGSVVEKNNFLELVFLGVCHSRRERSKNIILSLCGKEDDNFSRFYGFDMKLIDITIIEW